MQPHTSIRTRLALLVIALLGFAGAGLISSPVASATDPEPCEYSSLGCEEPPETTGPETSEPETTEPSTTVPDSTVPDNSAPPSSTVEVQPKVDAKYTCIQRAVSVYERTASLVFTLDPGSFSVHNWTVDFGPKDGIEDKTEKLGIPIHYPVVDAVLFPRGTYAISVTLVTYDRNVQFKSTFDVKDDCAKAPFPEVQPVYPPAPTFVDVCGSSNDGVNIPAFSEKYGYFKVGSDGYTAGILQPGFNNYTGIVIVTPAHTYTIPGSVVQRWAPMYTDVSCQGGPVTTDPWPCTGSNCQTTTTEPEETPPTTAPGTTVPVTVPPTTTPATTTTVQVALPPLEERRELTTHGTCGTFTIVNTGNVATDDKVVYGLSESGNPNDLYQLVVVGLGNRPLMPGDKQEIFVLEGATLFLFPNGWPVKGALVYKSQSCAIVPGTTTTVATAQPPVVTTTTTTTTRPTTPPTTTVPTTGTLPATGGNHMSAVALAYWFSGIGAVLCAIAFFTVRGRLSHMLARVRGRKG